MKTSKVVMVCNDCKERIYTYCDVQICIHNFNYYDVVYCDGKGGHFCEKHIKGVKKVFLTHGDDGPRSVLFKKIKDELGTKDIILPVMNQEIQI